MILDVLKYLYKLAKRSCMADENKEGAKGAFIEKLLFALLPLLIGCTGYLIQALGSIQHDVTILNQKSV